jgi:hypothetical protein
MPRHHQDNSTRANLERNLRSARRRRQIVPDWKNYEASDEDPRPIADPELEWEADKEGMIHVRKHVGETQMLEGYGTTDFGVPWYEVKRNWTWKRIILLGGILAGGIYLWKNRERILFSLEDQELLQ